MSRGKRVKAIDAPPFDSAVSIDNIGRFIKARRTQLNLSTQELAMLCGVSAFTLNKIENGFRGVKLATILTILDALGVELKVSKWKSSE